MAETELLPWVADRIREWFPELEGRAIPVTWGELTKEMKPRLPLAIVAPGRQTFGHNGKLEIDISERFIIEIWLQPERVKTQSAESPFFAYYNYNAFRDRLFDRIAGLRSPCGGPIKFERMEVEADEFAIVLSFSMVAESRQRAALIADPGSPDGLPAAISYSMCIPKGLCIPEPEEETDPCERN